MPLLLTGEPFLRLAKLAHRRFEQSSAFHQLLPFRFVELAIAVHLGAEPIQLLSLLIEPLLLRLLMGVLLVELLFADTQVLAQPFQPGTHCGQGRLLALDGGGAWASWLAWALCSCS